MSFLISTIHLWQVILISFDLYSTSTDNLVLFDGSSSNFPVLASLTGYYPGKSVYTTSHDYLFAQFTSGSSAVGTGFSSSFKSTTRMTFTSFYFIQLVHSYKGCSCSTRQLQTDYGKQSACQPSQHRQIDLMFRHIYNAVHQA